MNGDVFDRDAVEPRVERYQIESSRFVELDVAKVAENVGRILAAGGPFIVGQVASQGTNTLTSAMRALFWVGFPAEGPDVEPS